MTGHPEHDLMFVATQVARAAGLKYPATVIQNFQNVEAGHKLRVEELIASIEKNSIDGRMVKSNSWLFDETRVYQMLLRGHAPASESFRKWVTEEVLPTIRKTGKYDAQQSTNLIAQSVMDELKMLRQDIADLKALVAATQGKPVTVKSPYEGTEVNSRGSSVRPAGTQCCLVITSVCEQYSLTSTSKGRRVCWIGDYYSHTTEVPHNGHPKLFKSTSAHPHRLLLGHLGASYLRLEGVQRRLRRL
ncbi:BRO-N domain-containing protein [Pseudomonas syringae]|uniref:BRO-N domain-containing protein n=1 Tax=Pseudomonas syringae TaxID=317 RepID=UPI003D2F70C7